MGHLFVRVLLKELVAVSDPSHPAPAVAAADTISPDFDQAEVKFFGQEDGIATTAISRMLVLFFFYSLLIMGSVWYVLKSNWMEAQPEGSHGGHTETAPY